MKIFYQIQPCDASIIFYWECIWKYTYIMAIKIEEGEIPIYTPDQSRQALKLSWISIALFRSKGWIWTSFDPAFLSSSSLSPVPPLKAVPMSSRFSVWTTVTSRPSVSANPPMNSDPGCGSWCSTGTTQAVIGIPTRYSWMVTVTFTAIESLEISTDLRRPQGLSSEKYWLNLY